MDYNSDFCSSNFCIQLARSVIFSLVSPSGFSFVLIIKPLVLQEEKNPYAETFLDFCNRFWLFT